jgi:sugar transferase (PEP-CTERM/EpsH1 system associated)
MQSETLEKKRPAFPDDRGMTDEPGRTRPLRIMHVVNSLGRGGTELGVMKLVTGLDRSMFSHRICATREYDAEFVRLHDLKDRLDVAGTSNPGFQFPLFRLTNIFKVHRPDIVHTRNWGALEGVLAARLAGVPIVIHSEHGYEVDMLSGMPVRRRMFRRFVYSQADVVMAVTRELRDYHARQAWLNSGQVQVMYNGVDARKFAPSSEVRRRVRRELDISDATVVIGSVGRLVAIKDYHTLLTAGESLIQQGQNVHVLLVGAGPEMQSLKSRVGGSPALSKRTIFAGACDQIPAMLNAMDIFVLPSLGEGMSNTLLEAMAVGLPVVATKIGGNREVVNENSGGRFFAPGDAASLIRELSPLAESEELRGSAGEGSRKRALEQFSLEGMLRGYTELYRGLAERRGLICAN